jgi:hypothetical protein
VGSPKPVLGTITFRPHPWADSLKRHPHVQLLVVTLANRHALAERVVGFVGGEAFASENCGPAENVANASPLQMTSGRRLTLIYADCFCLICVPLENRKAPGLAENAGRGFLVRGYGW